MALDADIALEMMNEHFIYEFEMLFEMLRTPDQKIEAINNAVIESFCVHARCLLEFFEKEEDRRWFTTTHYVPLASISHSQFKRWMRRLNHQVSHLLEQRTGLTGEKIDGAERQQMADTLRVELGAFQKHLRPEFAKTKAATLAFPVLTVGFSGACTSSTTTSTLTFRGLKGNDGN